MDIEKLTFPTKVARNEKKIIFFSYKSYPSYTAFGEASFSCEFGSA